MSDSGTAVTFVIAPSRGWRALDLREVWQQRELVAFFVWRDLKVRFKQTVLGVAWVLLRPLLAMLVLSAVFWKVVKMPSDGIPYPLFVLTGMLAWSYLSTTVAAGAQSLVGSAHLITKVYFPRLVIPIAATLSGLVDTLASFAIALVLMMKYGLRPPLAATITLPGLLALLWLLSLGMSLWLGALNVRYRDVGALVPFLLQIWMYASPVVYPLSVVPARWKWVAAANPLAGIVEGFRSALCGRPWQISALVWSVVCAAGLVVGGLFFFRAAERTFADTV